MFVYEIAWPAQLKAKIYLITEKGQFKKKEEKKKGRQIFPHKSDSAQAHVYLIPSWKSHQVLQKHIYHIQDAPDFREHCRLLFFLFKFRLLSAFYGAENTVRKLDNKKLEAR